MKKKLLALLAIGGVSVAASHSLGSRPEVDADSPLAPCGSDPNCSRLSRAIAMDAETVRRVAEAAVRSDRGLFTGSVDELSLTGGGLRASYRVGPFTDDLALEVTEGADGGSVLHLRSASRMGRSDLGVNRRRLDRLVADIVARLGGA